MRCVEEVFISNFPKNIEKIFKIFCQNNQDPHTVQYCKGKIRQDGSNPPIKHGEDKFTSQHNGHTIAMDDSWIARTSSMPAGTRRYMNIKCTKVELPFSGTCTYMTCRRVLARLARLAEIMI